MGETLIEPKTRQGWKELLSWRVMLPLLGLLLTLAWGIQRWSEDRHYVFSDDVYVQGKITLVSSSIAGRVIALNVNEGDPVERGDILATVDRTGENYQRSHNTSKNLEAFRTLHKDMSLLKDLRHRENDEKDRYIRSRELLQSHFISLQKLEDIHTRWLKIRARRKELQEVIASEEQVLEVSEVHPMNATVFAPIGGQVAQRLVNLGETVKPRQPIVSLINTRSLSSIWLDAFVRETQVWKIKPGQKVRIHIDSWPGDTFYGHVLEFIPAASQAFSLLPAQNAAGTFVKVVQRIPVRIVFDSLQNRTILPGMSAEVWIDRRSIPKQGKGTGK
ncbi:MAG: HlyD family secretion protein [Nitrospirae bacterium]|nr:HlyD family secretion protein [Nitrospirota bacterium]